MFSSWFSWQCCTFMFVAGGDWSTDAPTMWRPCFILESLTFQYFEDVTCNFGCGWTMHAGTLQKPLHNLEVFLGTKLFTMNKKHLNVIHVLNLSPTDMISKNTKWLTPVKRISHAVIVKSRLQFLSTLKITSELTLERNHLNVKIVVRDLLNQVITKPI